MFSRSPDATLSYPTATSTPPLCQLHLQLQLQLHPCTSNTAHCHLHSFASTPLHYHLNLHRLSPPSPPLAHRPLVPTALHFPIASTFTSTPPPLHPFLRRHICPLKARVKHGRAAGRCA
uniref:Uncharacterized protein n=1 Tax=Haptolina brevifila TaxID=156173 RepID=A0A7S2C085_9EUKA|mmetsp:Transcript_1866/g.3773  ORF Transcript_1866/g.3773 Transcript_1866/m.3773 type:complete len:119 (+) Transcript_1866:286-642(+)